MYLLHCISPLWLLCRQLLGGIAWHVVGATAWHGPTSGDRVGVAAIPWGIACSTTGLEGCIHQMQSNAVHIWDTTVSHRPGTVCTRDHPGFQQTVLPWQDRLWHLRWMGVSSLEMKSLRLGPPTGPCMLGGGTLMPFACKAHVTCPPKCILQMCVDRFVHRRPS